MPSCGICRISLGANRHGSAKYCSKACAIVAKRAAQQRAHKKRYVKKEKVYRDEAHRQRCETQRNRALRRKLGLWGFDCQCIICGNRFIGRHSKSILCSHACDVVRTRELARESARRCMSDPQKRQRRVEYARELHQKNKEHRKVLARAAYARSPEKYRQAQRAYDKRNREKRRAQERESRKRNAVKIQARKRAYEDRIRSSFAALEDLGLTNRREYGPGKLKLIDMRAAVRNASELGLI